VAASDEIVISAQREELKLGTQASFCRNTIEDAPTVNRDIKDIIKQDPRVLIDPTNSSSIQIAGTSPRFNRITIDGIPTNDDFGLNNGG
jgi:outer membrane receptor for ferrienterochelin and colicin